AARTAARRDPLHPTPEHPHTARARPRTFHALPRRAGTDSEFLMPQRSITPAILAALLLCACGKSPAAKLEQARDLALAGHHHAALLEARASLFQLGDDRGSGTDDVRRGALKLAGDLCALHLDNPRCAAQEYRELVKRYPTAPESFEAREQLGDLDLRLGDFRGALEAWRDHVAAAPDRPGADVAQHKIARAQSDRRANPDARPPTTPPTAP